MEARYEHCEWLVPLIYMKRIALFFGIAFIALPGFGQVEQTQWTLVDAERDDRQIPCEVWYPSEPASTLPAVVFAHGFVMGADDYTGLAAALATEGYAFVSIATEQGFTPDHEAYGQDLAFVADEIAANAVGGALEGQFNGRTAIGGHSMGGGAAWLSVAAQPQIDAVFALAPAETNPSAIAAGSAMNVPAMVVSGVDDAVTPPAVHHDPIYGSAVNAPCRALVSIPDGGHCGFADPGTLCDLGELGFQGVSHAEQLALTVGVVLPWLDAFLKDDPAALDALEQSANDAGLDLELSCELGTYPESAEPMGFEVAYQNPPAGLVLKNRAETPICLTLWSIHGTRVMSRTLEPLERWAPDVQNGMYVVTAEGFPARSVVAR